MPAVHISELWVWEIDKFVSFSLAMDEDAEKPGSLPHAGSIYAILKIRSVYARRPKGKNTENGGPAACSPKFDNFGP